MVNGITAFRNYFKAYTDNYIIIGGTACDIVISNAGLTARATMNRKEQGENIDAKNIKKHKADIFRLSALLTDNDNFELPPTIFSDLQYFTELIKNDLPDSTLFKSMGLQRVKPDTLFTQLKKCFNLN